MPAREPRRTAQAQAKRRSVSARRKAGAFESGNIPRYITNRQRALGPAGGKPPYAPPAENAPRYAGFLARDVLERAKPVEKKRMDFRKSIHSPLRGRMATERIDCGVATA